MKKILLKLLIGFSVSIAVCSCYYDKADILYNHGAAGCDTVSAVLYSANVKPVLEQQCYNCHSGSSPSGGIAMGTYSADKAIAANGKLYGSISHAAGYYAMPSGQPALDVCTVVKIKKWIDAGSPNN